MINEHEDNNNNIYKTKPQHILWKPERALGCRNIEYIWMVDFNIFYDYIPRIKWKRVEKKSSA